MNYHSSWSREAISAMELSIAAHGGSKNWEGFESVSFEIRVFRGLLPFVKGLGKTFHSPKRIEVFPKERRALFHYDTHTDEYRDGRLIYSPQRLEVVDGRTLFTRSLFERWMPQHVLYFFGYAWTNYIGYPFILPEFELVGFEKSHSLTRFRIQFPDGIHTHSPIQTFYFDASGLLVRHDYRASIVGPIVFGAHHTRDYRPIRGIIGPSAAFRWPIRGMCGSEWDRGRCR